MQAGHEDSYIARMYTTCVTECIRLGLAGMQHSTHKLSRLRLPCAFLDAGVTHKLSTLKPGKKRGKLIKSGQIVKH